jgi:hypothetical protein
VLTPRVVGLTSWGRPVSTRTRCLNGNVMEPQPSSCKDSRRFRVSGNRAKR